MKAILDANPYADQPGDRAFAIFLDHAPSADAIARATGRTDESLAAGKREICALHPGGADA